MIYEYQRRALVALFGALIGLMVLTAVIVALVVGEIMGLGWVLWQILKAFGVDVNYWPSVGVVFLFNVAVSAIKLKNKK